MAAAENLQNDTVFERVLGQAAGSGRGGLSRSRTPPPVQGRGGVRWCTESEAASAVALASGRLKSTKALRFSVRAGALDVWLAWMSDRQASYTAELGRIAARRQQFSSLEPLRCLGDRFVEAVCLDEQVLHSVERRDGTRLIVHAAPHNAAEPWRFLIQGIRRFVQEQCVRDDGRVVVWFSPPTRT